MGSVGVKAEPQGRACKASLSSRAAEGKQEPARAGGRPCVMGERLGAPLAPSLPPWGVLCQIPLWSF